MNWIKDLSRTYISLNEISSRDSQNAVLYAQNRDALHNLLRGQFPAIHEAASSNPLHLEYEDKKDGVLKGIRHYRYKTVLDGMHMVSANVHHFLQQFSPDLADQIAANGNNPQDVQSFNQMQDQHKKAYGDIIGTIFDGLLKHSRKIDPNVTENDVADYIQMFHSGYTRGISGNNVSIHPGLSVHYSNIPEQHLFASGLHFIKNDYVPYKGIRHSLLTTPEHMEMGHPLQFTFDAHDVNNESPGGRAYSYEEI